MIEDKSQKVYKIVIPKLFASNLRIIKPYSPQALYFIPPMPQSPEAEDRMGDSANKLLAEFAISIMMAPLDKADRCQKVLI